MKKSNAKEKICGLASYAVLAVLTVAACWFFAGRYGVFGANMDWISQHSVFPEYFRQQFYQTGQFFPEYAANIGGGQNIYNFSYYGLYNPIVLIAYLLPFVKPSMVREIVGTREDGTQHSYDEALHLLIERENIDTKERNVLVSHQFYLPSGRQAEDVERMDSEIRTVGNIDEISADVLEVFDYAALGHIHKPMKVGSEYYCYCGTPLACSVSEAGQKKGIVMVTMKEKGNISTEVLPLTPLRQVRVIKGEFQEVLSQACEDYVTVVLTDKEDLDVIDLKDRLRNAFPYLLEIRRERERRAEYKRQSRKIEELDPFELCCSFLGEHMDEEEREMLLDVISSVQGVK